MTRKRMLLIMLVGVLCAFLLSCSDRKNEGKTDRWVNYAASNDGSQKYYDKQTIENVSPKVVRVWDKLKVSKDGIAQIIEERKKMNLTIDGWDKLESVAILREIDCAAKTNKKIRIEDYNDQGKKLYELDFPNPQTEPIPPGTMLESLRNVVCPK
jgi:hypothetical protein